MTYNIIAALHTYSKTGMYLLCILSACFDIAVWVTRLFTCACYLNTSIPKWRLFHSARPEVWWLIENGVWSSEYSIYTEWQTSELNSALMVRTHMCEFVRIFGPFIVGLCTLVPMQSTRRCTGQYVYIYQSKPVFHLTSNFRQWGSLMHAHNYDCEHGTLILS